MTRYAEGIVIRCISDSFECIQFGALRTIELDEEGLFIKCAEGKHYLEPLLNANGYIPEFERV